MVIKILGSGCRNCVKLKENTEKALNEVGMEAEVVKVEDFEEIMEYGVMTTPGLVIDDKVIANGKVLKPKEIVKALQDLK